MNGYYYFIINFTMTFYPYNHLYKKVGVKKNKKNKKVRVIIIVLFS